MGEIPLEKMAPTQHSGHPWEKETLTQKQTHTGRAPRVGKQDGWSPYRWRNSREAQGTPEAGGTFPQRLRRNRPWGLSELRPWAARFTALCFCGPNAVAHRLSTSLLNGADVFPPKAYRSWKWGPGRIRLWTAAPAKWQARK